MTMDNGGVKVKTNKGGFIPLLLRLTLLSAFNIRNY